MRSCWAAGLGRCQGGITSEHLFSKGLFSGRRVQVQGSLWKSAKPKLIGVNCLTANILCSHHNNSLSRVDDEGILAFRAIRRFEEILSGRQSPLHASDLQHDVDGTILERWFIKTAINLFVVSGENRYWFDGTAATRPPLGVVEAAFGLKKLQRPQGLYNWAGQIGERRMIVNQIGFQPIFRRRGEFIGAVFEFQALSFLIWFFNVNPRFTSNAAPYLVDFYHHMGGIFRAPPLSADFRVHWPTAEQ